jgi:hypothetical protein
MPFFDHCALLGLKYIVTYSGSISRWNFIALKIQYTTVNYSQQLFVHTYNLYWFSNTTTMQLHTRLQPEYLLLKLQI